jgi:hypothetical protein
MQPLSHITFDPGCRRWHVHLLCTNCEQRKHKKIRHFQYFAANDYLPLQNPNTSSTWNSNTLNTQMQKLPQCQSNNQMKPYGGHGGKAPRILNLANRFRWV